MEDNLLNIVMMIVAIFLLFIFPVYVSYEKKDDISYALALKYTQEFVDEIRGRGYLDLETYEDFEQKLRSTGNSYDISLSHTYIRYDSGILVESYQRSKEIIDETTILNYIENGYLYTMNVDDVFNVQIRNTNVTPATVLFNLITVNVNDENTRVYINYGGNVLAEKFNKQEAYHIFDKEASVSIQFGAPIPDGYKLVEGGTITTGMVIEKDSEKWLWIPVNNFYNFVRKGNNTINVIASQTIDGEWDFIMNTTKNMPVEFDSLSSYSKSGLMKLFAIDESSDTANAQLQQRYKYIQDMYSSVKKYGGFYVNISNKKLTDYKEEISGNNTISPMPITSAQFDAIESYISTYPSARSKLGLEASKLYYTLEMAGTIDESSLKRVYRKDFNKEYNELNMLSSIKLQTMYVESKKDEVEIIEDIISVESIQDINLDLKVYNTFNDAINNQSEITQTSIKVTNLSSPITLYYKATWDENSSVSKVGITKESNPITTVTTGVVAYGNDYCIWAIQIEPLILATYEGSKLQRITITVKAASASGETAYDGKALSILYMNETEQDSDTGNDGSGGSGFDKEYDWVVTP